MGEATSAGIALKASGAVAKWAWNHQDEIASRVSKLLGRTRRKLKGDDPSILILGAGGTGKTTLGRILSGEFNALFDIDHEYDLSLAVQTFRRPEKPRVEVVVGPGQKTYRAGMWPALLRRLSTGNATGIIHCCAYGYHNLTISYKLHERYNRRASPAAFLSAYLASRQADEIDVLKSFGNAIGEHSGRCWLLTLVGKEDLWCAEEGDVRDHYTSGPYGREVEKLRETKGQQNFRHEVVFGSLVIKNFVAARGELLKANTAGYDQAQQVRSLRRFLETLDALERWKVGKHG